MSTEAEIAARLAALPRRPWRRDGNSILKLRNAEGDTFVRHAEVEHLDQVPDINAVMDFLAAAPEDVAYLLGEVERLRAEVAEHRAARGLEAPKGWRYSFEGLWERHATERRWRDEDGEVWEDECPDGTLVVEANDLGHGFRWAWRFSIGKVRAEGTADTCLGAFAAAEAALAGGGQ